MPWPLASVERPIEEAFAAPGRARAPAQDRAVLAARAGEPGLARRLERAYFGQDVPTAPHA